MGVAIEKSECWVTTDPCLDCTKLLIQARVGRVTYWKPYKLPRQESQQLRSQLRDCASTITVFEEWTPDWQLLAIDSRYTEIRDRLQAYANAHQPKLG